LRTWPSTLRFCTIATLLCGVLLVGATACGSPTRPSAPTASPVLRSEVGFGFDIVDLQTDHQFPGQRSTFHVSYVYRDGLQGAGFDPAGHSVPADTYPYFQDIRDGMVAFIRTYPDKGDFYEVFLGNLARDVMTRYPQLTSLDIRIDVPAYGGVLTARTGTVHTTRG
jgi:hypothetical protein